MKPVEQTTPRNCVAACVASIFECPIEEVDIAEGGGLNEVARWTAEHYPVLTACSRIVGGIWHGDVWLDTYPPAHTVEPPFLLRGYWIAGAISPRGGMQLIDGQWKPSLHAVVMYGREVAWDPHPDRETGIGGLYDATWWIVRDPAAVAALTREQV